MDINAVAPQSSEQQPTEEVSRFLHEEKVDENHPEIKGNPRACLFVASLNAALSDQQLCSSVTQHFEPFGPLISVKVMKDTSNRPYAFVQFQRVQDADRAMKQSQASILDNRAIRIERAKVNRTLFLGRLSPIAMEQDLIPILSEYGDIEHLQIIRNNFTGESKGCAFATFKYREDALNAYTQLKAHTKWIVDWKSPAQAPPKPLNQQQESKFDKLSIFVGNLNPMSVTVTDIRESFGKYGTVEDINLYCKCSSDRAYAFAYVKYENEDTAGRAIQESNGLVLNGRLVRVQQRDISQTKFTRRTLSAPCGGQDFISKQEHYDLEELQPEEEWSKAVQEPLEKVEHMKPEVHEKKKEKEQETKVSDDQQKQQPARMMMPQATPEQLYAMGYYYPYQYAQPPMVPMEFYWQRPPQMMPHPQMVAQQHQNIQHQQQQSASQSFDFSNWSKPDVYDQSQFLLE